MRILKNKKFLYLILGVSISMNLVFFYFDFAPYYNRFLEKKFPEKTIKAIDEKTSYFIYKSSFDLIETKKSLMTWSDSQSLTESILELSNSTRNSEFKLFNYPRAYLYYGLTMYEIEQNGCSELDKIAENFNFFLEQKDIQRIDQVPFGLTALKLYLCTGKLDYLEYAHLLYEFVTKQMDDDEVVSYRKGQKVVYYDVLGMIMPFLMEYYRITKNESVLELAVKQMKYYINYGVDKDTFIPAHAISKESKIKVGSSNWGRGIGWYFVALSHIYKETGYFEDELDGIINSLNKIRNEEGLWSQFPGSSEKFDASTTTMFLYGMIYSGKVNLTRQETLKLLKNYISKEGLILQTSGDTYSSNNYSKSFGKSELSQGFLMLILSELK